MNLELENSVSKTQVIESNNVDDLITDLKNYLENDFSVNKNMIENKKQYNFIDLSERYQNFWEYKNDFEDNVCATLGISRYDRDIKYNEELYKAVEKSIFEITKREGTALYIATGPMGSLHTSDTGKMVIDTVYDVNKYENGKIEYLKTMEIDSLPKDMDSDGNYRKIIYQINEDGKVKIREDLEDEIIKSACEKCSDLREKTVKEAKEYKKEGHLYEVHEFDGYTFFNDITEENYSFEDIDFVVDNFKGEGTYQVIDGEYTKISDEFYSEMEGGI